MHPMKTKMIAIVAILCGTIACTAEAAIVITGNPADQSVRSNGTLVGNTSDTSLTYGIQSGQNAPVLVFELPNLAADTKFSTANLTFRYARTTDSQSVNGDLYGLATRDAPTVLTTDFSATATLLEDNIIVGDLGFNSARTANTSDGPGGGDEALTAYLNAQLAATAAQRALGDTFYVFLRLSPDGTTFTNFRRYYVTSADATTNQPTITYETALIPEPGSLALMGVGVCVMLARRRIERKN